MHNKDTLLYVGQLVHDHVQEKCEYLRQIRALNIERVDLIQSMNAQALIETNLRREHDRVLTMLQDKMKDHYEVKNQLEKVMKVITSNTDINIIRSRTLKIMTGKA